MIDPITTIAAISAGLKLIEQFRELALRNKGRVGSEPSVSVETVPVEKTPTNAPGKQPIQLEIKRQGTPVEVIRSSDLRMGVWDQRRYDNLQVIISRLWDQYNALDAAVTLASPLEKTKMKQQMDEIRKDLCPKFREMLHLYEQTLGVPLGDHFALGSVCSED